MMAVINDDRVILLEETLKTNREMIEENKLLRDQLKAKEEENSKVLQDVLKELRDLKGNPQQRGEPRSRGRKTKKVQVPPTCRVSCLQCNNFLGIL